MRLPAGDAVVVLGMHRSGTSGLASALSNLGVYLGKPDELLFGNLSNVEGHFELHKLVYLNERLLWYLGQTYFRVRPMPADWQAFPKMAAFMDEADAILSETFAGQKLWGWKEPRTSMLVPFYKQAFGQTEAKPHYLIAVRNPVDVVGSMLKREGFDRMHSLGLWLRHTLASLSETIGESRAIVLYEDLLAEPRSAIQPLVDLIPGWSPEESDWQSALSAVRPSLSHHKAGQTALEGLPRIAVETFELCLEATRVPRDFAEGQFDDRIRQLAEELDEWSNLLAAPPFLGDLIIDYQREGEADREEQMYPAQLGWRELRFTLSPVPGSPLRISFANAICSVLIRRIAWVRGERQVAAPFMPGHDARMYQGPEKRLWVVGGPEQLLVKAPDEPGEWELTLDFCLEPTTDGPLMLAGTLLQEIDHYQSLSRPSGR